MIVSFHKNIKSSFLGPESSLPAVGRFGLNSRKELPIYIGTGGKNMHLKSPALRDSFRYTATK
jgi:hypothetical protein